MYEHAVSASISSRDAQRRGSLQVAHAAHHPSPARPFLFRCYATDLSSFELSCRSGSRRNPSGSLSLASMAAASHRGPHGFLASLGATVPTTNNQRLSAAAAASSSTAPASSTHGAC